MTTPLSLSGEDTNMPMNMRMASTFLFAFLIAVIFVLASMVFWTTYGALRRLTLPQRRKDLRNSQLILLILLGTFLLVSGAFLYIAWTSRTGPDTAVLTMAVGLITLLTASLLVFSILTYTYLLKDKFKQAKTTSLIGGIIAGVSVLLVFLSFLTVSARGSLRLVTRSSSVSL